MPDKYETFVRWYLRFNGYFGVESFIQSLESLGIKQITFREMAKFLLQTRTPSFYFNELGVRSPHQQWDPLIKEIWKIGDPDDRRGLEEQEDAILALLSA